MEKKNKPKNCCPDHSNWRNRFDPTTNKDVLHNLEQGQQREKIDINFFKKQCIVSIFDNKMEIQKDNIIISENAITFNNQIPGFNFAGATPTCEYCGSKDDDEFFCCDEVATCWHSSHVDEYIKIEKKPVIEYNCLPPIPYITSRKGHHLRLDIFHSDLVRSQASTIQHYTLKKNRWN